MNYLELLKKVESYKNQYKIRVIGKTKFKRKIFAVERNLNKNFATAIFVCSIHARENIATDLVCKMIDDGVFEEIKDFNLSFVLMANPDGVELVENGISSVPEKHQKNLLKMNQNSQDFRLWKANANGVDLNNNFDARFGTNVNSKIPSSSGFVGKCAESENETKAIVRYLKNTNPFIVICYHTKGEEIYFNFFQSEKELERDKIIVEKFAKSTGYKIKNPEMTSSGGLKDYVIEKLKIPSLTIELGSDELSHPIKKDSLNEIFSRNKLIAKDLKFAYNVFVRFKEK
ncbi:MAG: hypothetical protein IKD36_02240 [Clostridia bacterium]|nr:hypothetical protein [Clostridia bacterium]